jgi:hypothetical protein
MGVRSAAGESMCIKMEQIAMSVRFARAVALSIGACTACGRAEAQDARFADAGLLDGKVIIDTRLRYESVDQGGLANDAEAATWRSRLGFETGRLWNTSLLAEGEFVWPLTTDYNSTTNGKLAFPVVADAENHEINRLQLTNSSLPKTTITAGRQRIMLDDQRFIGNVGWRQNEQTFDSLRIVNGSLTNVTFDLAYVAQVNRVFGKASPQGRYEGDSMLANVSWRLPIGKVTGFGYWLEFEPMAAAPAAARDASRTFGVRLGGEKPLGPLKLTYAASYATQREYADNPLTFDLDYTFGELNGAWSRYNVGVGVEVLDGDGSKGFTTPLATLHRFQGWADKFLTTPPNGVEDRFASAGVTFKGLGRLETLAALGSYHLYEAQRTSAAYGSEINMQLQAKLGRFAALLKYADYSADDLFSDTAKFWAQVEYLW